MKKKNPNSESGERREVFTKIETWKLEGKNNYVGLVPR